MAGVPHFADPVALMDSGRVDAVLVAAPSHLHAGLAEAAFARGLHVLMAKPLGLAIGEARRMVERVPEGLQLGVMLNQRHDPLFARLRELVAAGALGTLQRTHWTMTT